MIVDLGDHDAGVLHSIGELVDANAEAAPSHRVRRSDLDEGDVAGQGAIGEQPRER